MSLQSAAAGCGGAIRDCSGGWIVGFSCKLGVCSAIVAKEWAVVEGVQLAWDLGFKKLILESDASAVINLIMGSNCNSCSNLILKASELISLNKLISGYESYF